MRKKLFIAFALVLSLTNSLFATPGQAAMASSDKEAAVQTAPVRIDGAVLFPVRGVSSHPADERAAAIAKRITALADEPSVNIQSIVAIESDHSTDLMAGDRFIMSIFDGDAEIEGVNRQVLAKVYADKVGRAVEAYRQNRSTRNILQGAGSALGVTLLLIGLILLIGLAFRKLLAAVEARLTARIKELQDKSHDILRTEVIWGGIRGGLRFIRIILVLLIIVVYMQMVLSLFPWTRAYAVPLLDMVRTPLQNIGSDFLNYIPKLFFLIILVLVTRYFLKILRTSFLGVEQGRIKISGFEAIWAIPVYKVARLAVIAFTVVVAYPYIPGSESQAFKGVSLFLGIVFSLGSSSTIANIMAGYMVIFRRAFKVGDRIKIGDQTGTVIEMRLQATHLRTIKNEEVIIPNANVLNNEVINYSSLSLKGGLILHTAVTIGYDTPWRQVHAMLLLAAERTAGLLREPQPFVLQTSLDDFYVSYELNAYTDRPLEMATIYSDLHKNIQDAFNEFNVQIMSPHYESDPSQIKIVPKEQWYQAPAKRDERGGGPA